MKISVSREGLKTISRSGLSPLARIEAGYQAFARSGPGYDEELARPVQALVLLGRPRLLLVRGNWRHGRYGQYHVARGADFLEPHSASEVSYVPLGKTDEAWPFPDPNEETAAVKEPFPSPSEGPRNAYDSLMRANWAINEVFYGFIGRESNEWVFRDDDFALAQRFAARHEAEPTEFNRSVLEQVAPNVTVVLINDMMRTLGKLGAFYAADREAVRAWRRERTEAYDALRNLRSGGDLQAHRSQPEYVRWQAIADVGPLEYARNAAEEVRGAGEEMGRDQPQPGESSQEKST